MIKCHPSTTPWRRAWPGMLPRYARPVRGGPPLWGGWRVTLNHFWSARSGEEEGWAWIAVHRGQHSCHVINEFEINVFATTRCYSLLATHLRVVVKTPTQPYLGLGFTRKWLHTTTTNSMSAISQLLLARFWPNLKGRFLGPSLTDPNSHGDICPFKEYCQAQPLLNSIQFKSIEVEIALISTWSSHPPTRNSRYLSCWWPDLD